ncbi:MAG: hypothetical protein K8R46_12265, partial [Pirellulales bacterium]|nr:hypothetical protein [Pirellulales bacterium]
ESSMAGGMDHETPPPLDPSVFTVYQVAVNLSAGILNNPEDCLKIPFFLDFPLTPGSYALHCLSLPLAHLCCFFRMCDLLSGCR